MKQVVQSARTGKLALKEVPAPKARSGHLLVRVRASVLSAGTERMVVEFAQKSLAGKAKARPDLVRKVVDKAKRDGVAATFKAVMARLDEPLPLGYSAAGTVEELGAGLEGRFRVGQRVAIAGAGLANHAEFDVVPANLVAALPDDVTFEDGAFATLAAIALHGARNLGAGLGDVVAVLGVGLVGQIAVQLLALAGARVLALDYDPRRLDLARTMGAELAWNLAEPEGLEGAVGALSGGLGCDGILICAATDSSEPLELAARLARDRARVSLLGKTGTEFPFADYMKKELSIVVSRSYGPGRYDEDFEGQGVKYPEGFVRWTETANLGECARLMRPSLARRLNMAALVSHRFPFAQAEAAYDLVLEGREAHLGVVLTYPEDSARATALPAARPGPAKSGLALGVIGAGAYARTVLLPLLKGMAGLRLASLATQRGMTAEHAQAQFGFAQATTDAALLFDDPRIDALLIATRHASHSDFTAQALAAGKAVLVEKPLALTEDEINAVVAARLASKAFFMVGFNRRFAPLAIALRDQLARHAGAKTLAIRINAGPLAPGSWIVADEGGGRILGEACHFVDLARFLVGAPIQSVQAEGGRGETDELAANLAFADGSLASLVYTAQGDPAYAKERIEAFAGGAAFNLDNFLALSTTEGGRTKTRRPSGGQDKGQRAMLEAFVAAAKTGGPAPIDEAETVETSRATLALMESIRTGQRIAV